MLRRLEEAGLDASLCERLADYGMLLLDANRRFNVTGAKTSEDLQPHLLDSLSLVPFVRGAYVDVGSGGGLPAIPVALAAEVPVTLIEPAAKKAAFLRAVLERLRIPGGVLAQRAEVAGAAGQLREQFETVTGRAVASPPAAAELMLPLVRVGGRAIVQCGMLGEEERSEVEGAAALLGARLAEVHQANGNRVIVILQKVAPTPERFPRRVGIPQKRPLRIQA